MLEQFGHRAGFERDDALMQFAALLRVEGEREAALAGQHPQVAGGGKVVAPLRHGTQAQIVAAFDHHEPQGPVSLQLQHQAALELEASREQRARREELAQQPAQQRRIGVAREHFAIGRRDVRTGAARTGSIDQEGRERVRIRCRHASVPGGQRVHHERE